MVEDLVSARSFELVDENGNRRACLATDPEGDPALQFFGPNGALKLQIAAGRDKPSIQLLDNFGKVAMHLVVVEEGSGIQIHDGAGLARAIVYVDRDGTSSFELWESQKKAPVMIRLKPDGSYEGTFERLSMEFVTKPKLELVPKDNEPKK